MKRNYIIIMIIITSIVFSLTLSTLSAYSEDNDFHTSDSSTFMETDTFANLNYGMYWVRKDNIYERALTNNTDAYDKDKPTIIFIHGWLDKIGYYQRETLAVYRNDWVDTNDSVNLADYWIDAGYNVLMYHWNQLCDEAISSAEAKIWTLDGYYGMRWRKNDGTYTDENDPSNPTKPVAVSFIEEYLNLLGDTNGQEIRMTGHSMGGMLAIAAMGILYEKYLKGDIDGKLLPTRLSLMDAYLGGSVSSEYNIYWKEDTDRFKTIKSEMIRVLMKDYLKKFHLIGIAIDYYWGTTIGQSAFLNDKLGEGDFDISPYVVLIKYDASAIATDTGFSKIGTMHCAIRDFYLYSIAFPEVKDNSVEGSGNYAITASTPSSVVYSHSGKYYGVGSPNKTLSPVDDDFIMTTNDYMTVADYTGRISGFVFNDINRNGLKDDGITKNFKNVKISLFNSDNQLINTTLTNDIGYYSITSPGIGSYYIVFDKVKGGSYTTANVGNYLDIPSLTDEEGRTSIFTLTSATSDIVINSGQVGRDYLSAKYIILYSIAGIILLSSITLFILTFTKKQHKNEKKIK